MGKWFAPGEDQKVLRVITYQGLVTIAVAILFLGLGSNEIWSSVFGGIIAVVNSLLLARSVNNAGVAASEQKNGKRCASASQRSTCKIYARFAEFLYRDCIS